MSFKFDASQRYLAKTNAEFTKLLDDALFEVEEYIICVQDDLEDELDDLTTSLEQIAAYLKQLHSDAKNGQYRYSTGADLDYLPLIRKLRHVLPFYDLLVGINNSHHRGVEG